MGDASQNKRLPSKMSKVYEKTDLETRISAICSLKLDRIIIEKLSDICDSVYRKLGGSVACPAKNWGHMPLAPSSS